MPNGIFYFLQRHIKKIRERLKTAEKKRIYNLSIPHLALLLLFNERPFIVIEDSDNSASTLYNDLLFFYSAFSNNHPPFVFFPSALSFELIGERVKALYKLAVKGQDVENVSIITSLDAYKTGFNIREIKGNVLTLKKNMEIQRAKLEEWLASHGYRSVSVVVEKGEFSQRGWLFDIYSSAEENPVRVEFFGDCIELIRTFDVETQRSIKEVEEINIFPAEEGEPANNLIEDLTNLRDFDVFAVDHHSIALSFQKSILISHLPFISEGIDSGEMAIKGLGILPEERKDLVFIPEAIRKIPAQHILLVAQSNAQAERMKEIMEDGGIISPIIEGKELRQYDGMICITKGRLSSGLNLQDILILTDKEIFGERPAYRPIKRSRVSRLLISIDDLRPGDFVVHKDHGIGRFLGLQRQKTEDYEEDLIIIEYSNARLYVPFYSVEKLQKYSAAEGYVPSLDRLGGKAWAKTKQKVKKGISEMAERLLRLYAERKMAREFTFSEDTAFHREFDEFFPYDETPDQIKAIEEIKKHLYSETPMDMLLCGDVGYGKTEVAMRAAFRAVYDGKQVAVLVPTTLLAEQHFRTFKTRFSGFPVKIDYLSRFKTKDEMKKTIKAIADGEVDIVIGTHALLNKNVCFHDIGLLIIDEEHRFGVAQKERLKELKKKVDVLTLTATPIPRTLQMSLSGIREMCTIETPPEERLAVRSAVVVFNADTIREAIERELKRDGQVFFVHNRIADIEKIANYVRSLVPYAKIAVVHGQMKESELEKIMMKFLNKEINVLICTAIIGSGLDITTANTIIINRADLFGLSDLYQLRGRVGRGNVQAYAYFLIPGEDVITDDAKKRLKAIQEMSYLGAGFRLALKDLEIRGAGNILGPEQSGHIYKVGFDMYMEMLEKAVSELKGQEIREDIEPQIRLKVSAFIPEDYISDNVLRLSIYRRLASTKETDALSAMKEEIIDRFGKMPKEVENLIDIMRIKILAARLYISKITESDGLYRLYFASDAERYKIPKDFFDKLLKELFKLQKTEKIRFLPDGFEINTGAKSEDGTKKLEQVLYRLSRLAL